MKILVGYDDTNAAREAIALAEQHARVFGAEIILVYSMVEGRKCRAKTLRPPKNLSNMKKKP